MCPDMCVNRPLLAPPGESVSQRMGDLGLVPDQVTSKSRDQMEE